MRARVGLVWLFLFLLPFQAIFADKTVEAELEEVKGKLSLFFDSTLETVFEKFSDWEAKLKAQGIDAEFFIGAGELRRALMHAPSVGPGDFEVFLHLRDHRVRPLTVPGTFVFLKSHGIDVEGELHELLGEEKEIDFFVKDESSFEYEKPYQGAFGYFEGMEAADFSINQLLYSPTDNTIYGNSEYLRSLLQRKIQFTEPYKANRLDKAVKITNIEGTTWYKPTLLRLTFRAIRLKMDLMLFDNPQELSLGASFTNVLQGFEQFFEGVAPEEIAKYSLNPADETHFNQFWKIFRNRSNEELAEIRRVLEDEHPGMCAIWKALGLDYELLTSSKTARTNLRKREHQSVIANARYDVIRPFVDTKTMKVKNPFKSKSLMGKLLDLIPLKNKKKLVIQEIPMPILERYSMKLAMRVGRFGELDLEAQVHTLKDYLAALALFSQPAPKQVREVSFREERLERFSFANVSNVAADDNRSLLQFLTDELQRHQDVTVDSYRWENAWLLNQQVITRLKASAAAVAKGDQTPVIFIDLDNTVFSWASRVISILRKFDLEFQTDYFSGLTYHDFPSQSTEAQPFVYEHLSKTVPLAELELIFETFKTFYKSEMGKPEHVEKEVVSQMMVEQIKAFKRLGSKPKIVFLSYRWHGLREVTEAQLKEHKIPFHDIILEEFEEEEGGKRKLIQKPEQIRRYLAANADHQAVGFLDDNRDNIRHVSEAFPQIVTGRVILRNQPDRETPEAFILADDLQMYDVLTLNQSTCAAEMAQQI